MSTDLKHKELSQKITHDLFNHEIKIGNEEKCKRIKEMFRMVNKFEHLRGVKCSKILFESTILPRYIGTKPQRLSKMFKWLCDNWKQYKKDFPEIPDFEEARRQTAENNPPDTFEKNFVNRKHSYKDLASVFEDIREELPTKPASEIHKHSQVSLYRRMAKANMVFRADKGKWVAKEGIGVDCGEIDPRPVVENISKRVVDKESLRIKNEA